MCNVSRLYTTATKEHSFGFLIKRLKEKIVIVLIIILRAHVSTRTINIHICIFIMLIMRVNIIHSIAQHYCRCTGESGIAA